VPSNASEYPIVTQTIPPIAIEATHIMKVFRAFFARTRPA
jgi:hypothetical protein